MTRTNEENQRAVEDAVSNAKYVLDVVYEIRGRAEDIVSKWGGTAPASEFWQIERALLDLLGVARDAARVSALTCANCSDELTFDELAENFCKRCKAPIDGGEGEQCS